MAIKLLSLDKQYLDNNLLTDEDFQFDMMGSIEDDIDEGLLPYIQNNHEELSNTNIPVPDNDDDMLDDSIIDLLNDHSYQIHMKQEPLSPYYSSSSSEEGGFPLLQITDSGIECYADVITTNTPPCSPPNLVDSQSNTVYSTNENIILPDTGLRNPVLTNIPTTLKSFVSPKTTNRTSEIRIKPKPVMNKTMLNQSGDCKPIVLTPEQFTLLTNGKLKINSISERQPVLKKHPSVLPRNNSSVKPVNVGMPATHRHDTRNLNSKIDLTALKRQQRMIKNRESACLSRRKKREYLQKLESELKEVSTANTKLQVENTQLKQRVFDLERENDTLKMLNQTLRSKLSPKALKKTTGLMVVLFMITLNLAPLSQLFHKGISDNTLKPVVPHRVGRSLLWNEDINMNDVKNKSSSFFNASPTTFDETMSASFTDDWDSLVNITMCPTFINRTESLRLENDLRGWVQRVETKRKQKQSMSDNSKIKKQMPPLPKLQSWMKKNNRERQDPWAAKIREKDITLYHTPRRLYEDFFDAIHRRDDTFYFVSFSGDHLLLPATMHNQTLRPRMSLVMPAMTFNDSTGKMNEHISLMQIDCEVMNTKLVYVKESVIPAHLRQKQNNTKIHLHKKSATYPINDKSSRDLLKT